MFLVRRRRRRRFVTYNEVKMAGSVSVIAALIK